MASTVLALIQSFCRKKGLEVPTVVVASTSGEVLQLMELYLQVGRFIRNKRGWQALKRRATFTALAAEDQGTLAAVLGEANPDYIAFDTVWDNTDQQPLYGPVSDAEYQAALAFAVTGPIYEFQIRQDHLRIIGGGPVGHSLTFMFKSSNWVQTTSASGVFQDTISADTNVPIFGDDLMMLGLECFYRREKGLEFSTFMANFEMELIAKNDGAQSKIDMSGGSQDGRIPGIIVPVTGY
jgi:hypothetical protein